MVDYFAGTGTSRQRLALSPVIARGAAGDIHHVLGRPGVVAKLYRDPADRKSYERKIAIMVARPPNLPDIIEKGRTCVQIAWPTDAVYDGAGTFAGFLMPEVDFKHSRTLDDILQKAGRQGDGLPEFDAFRVLLGANLSSLMAALHACGHFMIDMKPMNMRFYPDLWYMAVIDTDGFSIKGDRTRMPSGQVSDDYIAPEAQGKRPEDLAEAQDRFALAVIIFQLLNNGIHPYQGVSRSASGLPTDLQSRIFEGLYAYGVRPHGKVGPRPASIHKFFDDDTRQLFDRAFEAGAVRPSAAEWADHLKDLLSHRLVKCSVRPTEHGHFSKGCGHCANAKRAKAAQRTNASTAPPAGQMSVASVASVAAATGAAAASAGGVAVSTPDLSRWVWGGLAASAVLGTLLVAMCSPKDARLSATPAEDASPSSQIAPILPNESFAARTLYVRPGEGASSINMRMGPGTGYAARLDLSAEQIVAATGLSYGTDDLPWFYIQSGGATGYVKGSLLRDPSATSPSFDCRKASTWSEMMICSYPALADADRRMAALYDQVIGQSGPESARNLRDDQRAWVSRRDGCRSTAMSLGCLTTLYSDRAAFLSAWAGQGSELTQSDRVDQSAPSDSPAASAAPLRTEAPQSLNGRATVNTVGRLTVNGWTVRLYGLRPAGTAGARSLERLISGGAVECTRVSGDAYRCITSSGADIAETAILNGLAYASGPDYRDVETEAREQRLGVWSSR